MQSESKYQQQYFISFNFNFTSEKIDVTCVLVKSTLQESNEKANKKLIWDIKKWKKSKLLHTGDHFLQLHEREQNTSLFAVIQALSV